MNRKQKDDLYQIVKIVENQSVEESRSWGGSKTGEENKTRRGQVDPEEIRPYLNEYIRLREVPENQYIIREEDRMQKVYYVIQGTYDMRRTSLKGQIKVLAKRRAPQFIGIDKAFNRKLQGDFASMAVEKCIVLEIHQDYFVNCVRENGDLAVKIIQNLSEKLVKTSLELDYQSFNDTREQLMYYICQYWKDNGMKSAVDPNMNQRVCRIQETNSYTADHVGMSIRSFYRARSGLEREGLISVNKGFIEVNESQMEKIEEFLY